MIPVVWLNFDHDALARGMWDQGLLELVLAGEVSRLRYGYEHHEARDELDLPGAPGAVVVLPGRFHADRVDRVNAALARYGWVVLLVTSDEESLFPADLLRHPRLRLWVMTPHPTREYPPGTRFLGEYFAADTPSILSGAEMHRREVDVGFWGQITHERRERFDAAFRRMRANNPEIAMAGLATDSFAAGAPRDEYLRMLANTKVAPSPAGPATADSFRLFEALEAGCVPIADSRADGLPEGYWHRLLVDMTGEAIPFPVLDDWTRLEPVALEVLDGWAARANTVQAWWQRYKRGLVLRLEDDVEEMSGLQPERDLASLVTVIVPTSPIPSHPDTAVIDETLDSVQERLPGCEVVVVFDGVRREQADRAGDYEEYKRRLLRSFSFGRRDVVPLVLEEHLHQAGATRAALDMVRTPLVLFVEHDTPLVGEIPFAKLAAVVAAGEANLIRLHHEASVLEPHRHLMIDVEPRDVMGVPLLGTVQWSQRPHLASTAFYRHVIGTYFGRQSRTMIEDVMHGVAQSAARGGGWGMFRLFMYAPPGDIKRSTHLDGRGDDPKFDDRFVIAYDGAVPDWAPRPSAEREEHRQPASHDEDGP